MPKREEWDKTELLRLRNMHQKGFSYDFIAKRLGRTAPAVAIMANRIGLERKPTKEWTEDELRRLTTMYRSKNYSVEDIAKRLNRTPQAVKMKANRIGLKNVKRNAWTDYEINLLKTLCDDVEYDENDIAEALGRTKNAVHVKIWHLGLENRTEKGWTDEQVAILKAMYPDRNCTLADIAHRVGKNTKAVFYKAKRLGFLYRRSAIWMEEEDEVLLDMFEQYRYSDIAKVLGRTKDSVASRARYLGLQKPHPVQVMDNDLKCPTCKSVSLQRRVRKGGYICKRCSTKITEHEAVRIRNGGYVQNGNGSYKIPWSEDEKQFLKDNPDMRIDEMAQILGREEGSVRAMRKNLKVRKWHHRRWTESEMQYVYENYHNKTKRQLAGELGVSMQQIVYMARKLGVTNIPTCARGIADDTLETIKERYPVEDTATLAGELGYSPKQLHTIASQFGIKKLPRYLQSRIKNEREMGYWQPLQQAGSQ